LTESQNYAILLLAEDKMNPRRWKLLPFLSMIFLVSTMGSACGGTAPAADQASVAEPEALKPVALGPGEKLEVVATTNIVGDVVSQVGGDRIRLTTLMGIGVDPHSYVPTPTGTAAIHDAHVLFANGAGLEANLDKMVENAGGNAVEVIVSKGIELRRLAGDHVGEGETGHKQENTDPHVWFDVKNVIHWVDTIERTLCALDPANRETYQANAVAYVHQLEELDAWVVEQVATLPQTNRKLVTNHPAFGYLADRYGLEQVGAVYPISPSAEPSAQDIAALEDTIRELAVQAVFTESTVNPTLAQQVAADTGVRLVALYSGSLGGPGSGAESYLELMRYDVTAIVGALR
jgi:ABC-type Zn uptake system ZnuABC Zn-binding protein ZnuA